MQNLIVTGLRVRAQPTASWVSTLHELLCDVEALEGACRAIVEQTCSKEYSGTSNVKDTGTFHTCQPRNYWNCGNSTVNVVKKRVNTYHVFHLLSYFGHKCQKKVILQRDRRAKSTSVPLFFRLVDSYMYA